MIIYVNAATEAPTPSPVVSSLNRPSPQNKTSILGEAQGFNQSSIFFKVVIPLLQEKQEKAQLDLDVTFWPCARKCQLILYG